MGSQVVAARMLQSVLSVVENEALERSCILTAANAKLNSSFEPGCSGQTSKVRVSSATSLGKKFQTRKGSWRLSFALNQNGLSGNGQEGNPNGENSNLGTTRLGRIVTSGAKGILQKLNSARKNFPMKIFLLLLGFYTANALATILGQTGDWDVLVAGVVVATIEGIGMVMYRRRRRSMANAGRFQSLVEMINYWKAGVILGLFVDAFKLGS